MTDNQKILTSISIVAGVLLVGKLAKTYSQKSSSFVDENQSEAEGNINIPAGAAKQKYRPNSWAKVGNNWIWVNTEGNLVITDAV